MLRIQGFLASSSITISFFRGSFHSASTRIRATTTTRRFHRLFSTTNGILGNTTTTQQQQQQTIRRKSTAIHDEYESLLEEVSSSQSSSSSTASSKAAVQAAIQRLRHLRNVGVFAHVDAGKTTVTERMLALAGYVNKAGSVDDGNTVTDYLPAERERGITIQSAAIRFPWAWHNNRTGDDLQANDCVTINLIDTPGHVDFSVEVNRSVAVLDGAVLVVDAVAGVQAQTETVWRAMTHANNANTNMLEEDEEWVVEPQHQHEPLPCLAVVNKMDKVGNHFWMAVKSLRNKLVGANPIALQIPLFQNSIQSVDDSNPLKHVVALSEHCAAHAENLSAATGEFVGVVDLIHMRVIMWPDVASHSVGSVEACVPSVVPLLDATHNPRRADCHVTKVAQRARQHMMAALAEVDGEMEEYYLLEEEPSNAALRQAARRATLQHKALPVLAAAALRGKGIEPILDAIADLLPSPLDRQPPSLTYMRNLGKGTASAELEVVAGVKDEVELGHPLYPSSLAFAFKVLHMKGRG